MENRRNLNRIKQAIRKVLSEGMDSDFGGGVNGRPPGDMTRPVSNGTFNPNRSYYNGVNSFDPSYAAAEGLPPIKPYRDPNLPEGIPNPPYISDNPPMRGRVGVGSDGKLYVYGPNGYPYYVWNGQYWEHVRI